MRANASGCLDACEYGAAIVVYPDNVWYGGVTVDDIDEIIESHLLKDEPVERLRIPDTRYTPDISAGSDSDDNAA
jgi:(2Fe-2S) ferredoxin